MIINEFFREREDGVKLYRTYSDAGMMIQQEQTGVEYAEAIDVDGSGYTYVETDTPIEGEELTGSLTAYTSASNYPSSSTYTYVEE